jgi:hypothetical protein
MRWEVVADTLSIRRYELAANVLGDDVAPKNFRPRTVPHKWLPAEKHVFATYRIEVNGVCIKFDCMASIDVSIEGDLSQDFVDQVLTEIAGNLAESTGAEWKVRECPPEKN